MFSRNYLGVHAPQDVCVGLLTGIVFIFLSVKVLAWVDKGKNRDLAVVLTGYAVSAVFLIFVVNKSYPLDYVDGILIVDPLKMMPDSFLCAGMLCGFLTEWLYGNVHRVAVLYRNLSVSVQKEKNSDMTIDNLDV